MIVETAQAFDAHAQHYDALVESNALLQNMRAALWREVERRVPPPAHLLDLGCGTGIDAAYFARRGYQVSAIDSSPEMVRQTRARLTAARWNVNVRNLGAEQLEAFGNQTFDAIYSDLGPLNCLPDLRLVSRLCSNQLIPGGYLILSVMARLCPWEIGYFTLRGEFESAVRRFPKQMVPVKLENGVVWTRYYSPREFFTFFADNFRLVTYRSLNLVLPPPYLVRWYNRAGALARPISWLDETLSTLPLFRNMGDHFLMVLQK